ncbi:hypothetical protein HF1_11630 [Mycoplasma haemofelis str. Langford 1]|uniref:Uncharacterized protein n=1 Tax=Mycoplasma haemofelis (strain Langford 1) TaxID=941640 RepID=E8ZJ50_MYCHL|nr:hypothetical protein [Mycoplasma haemofelis]CBY93171.1 hypothetical protein HF1_11630 [Mycoplasma haemofelis str. Langford 1]
MDLTKVALAMGSGGTLATGAYLTKDHWMPSKEQKIKSIEDALKGRRLISSISDPKKQWEAEFESAEQAIKSLLGDTSLNKENGGVKLSEWCAGKMSLDVDKNQEVFKNVEQYCLIRSVSSQLSRKGKNLLKADSEEGWSETYKKRKGDSSNRDDVGLTKVTDWSKADETNDIAEVKKWCSKNSDGEFLASEDEANSLYTKVLKWCTKEGA